MSYQRKNNRPLPKPAIPMAQATLPISSMPASHKPLSGVNMATCTTDLAAKKVKPKK